MAIYEKIFNRLDELHMSQIELSRRTGIATSTISDWRKKQINPQADKLVSICKALDMTLVELLCVEENEEQTATNDYVSEENYMIELFRQSDTQSRRRIISYLALFEVCKQINDSNQSQQRNVSVVQDIDGNSIVVINDIRFKGKTFHRLEGSEGIFRKNMSVIFIRWRLPAMLYISDLICQVNIRDQYIPKG